MQIDGNLVIHGADKPNGSYQVLWASNTSGHPGATLAVQNNGSLVIVPAGGGNPLWSPLAIPTGSVTLYEGDSITSPNGQYQLTLGTAGNLVLQQLRGNGSTATLWASGTAGMAALEAVMQTDGNFVIYGADKPNGSYKVLWASNTPGHPGATLALQNDGSLVISPAGGGAPLWTIAAIPVGTPTLFPGDSITSPSGQYALTLRTDGNLVLDQLLGNGSTRVLWASGTAGQPAVEAVMQTDGNLVIYGADKANGSLKALWASNTPGHPGATLAVQDTGSLVISPAAGGTAFWATKVLPTGTPTLFPGDSITSPNGQYALTLQPDGNLVLDQLLGNGSTLLLWASNTAGSSAVEALMQTDGNLVIYGTDKPNGSYQVLWASNTSGHAGATLAVQNDGTLAITRAGGGTPIWAPWTPPSSSLTLFAGDSIKSPNGQYVLTLQPDGDLVLDQFLGNGSTVTLWDSGTAGEAAVKAVMQDDGNLVIYGPTNPDGSYKALWASNTSGHPVQPSPS